MSARSKKVKKRVDPQRKALYRWEEGWRSWCVNNLTLHECRIAIRTACALYSVEPPKVKQHCSDDGGGSWCEHVTRTISLEADPMKFPGSKNLATSLHEAAHFIVDERFNPNKIQDHGATFLGVYIWLLADAKIAPLVALQASARACGLRWRLTSPKQCKH